MIILRIAFTLVILTMLAVTIWASNQMAIWQIPHAVLFHPWFVATLFDTYFAFLTIWAWIAYKETSNLARIGWLVGIILLGNMAIAAYMLIQLWKLPLDAPITSLLVRK